MNIYLTCVIQLVLNNPVIAANPFSVYTKIHQTVM